MASIGMTPRLAAARADSRAVAAIAIESRESMLGEATRILDLTEEELAMFAAVLHSAFDPIQMFVHGLQLGELITARRMKEQATTERPDDDEGEQP